MPRLELSPREGVKVRDDIGDARHLLGKGRGGGPRSMAPEGRKQPDKPVGGYVRRKAGFEPIATLHTTETPQPTTPQVRPGGEKPNEEVFELPSPEQASESFKQYLIERGGSKIPWVSERRDPHRSLTPQEVSEAKRQLEEAQNAKPTDEEIVKEGSSGYRPINIDEYMRWQQAAQRIRDRSIEAANNDPQMTEEDREIAIADARFDYGLIVSVWDDRLSGINPSANLPKPPPPGSEAPKMSLEERAIYDDVERKRRERIAEIDNMKLPKSKKWLLKFDTLLGDELRKRLEAHRMNVAFAEMVADHESELEGFGDLEVTDNRGGENDSQSGAFVVGRHRTGTDRTADRKPNVSVAGDEGEMYSPDGEKPQESKEQRDGRD